MKKALFIGASCIDVILYLDRLPKTEEDIHPEKQIMRLGGCAGNAARAAKLVSADVELASPVGTGVFGELADKLLQEEGIEVRIRVPEENGCCYCFVEKGGERTFLSVHGAEYSFKREWMSAFDDMEIAYVYVSGLEIEEPTGEALISYLEELSERFPQCILFYCPGARGVPLKKKNERLFGLHPVLHLNRSEALALSGEKTVEKAAQTLRDKTGNAVIVTMGAEGVYCLEGAISIGSVDTSATQESDANRTGFYVQALKTQVVNTIGAGDTHAGVLIASLLEGASLRAALENANFAAAAAVASEEAVPSGLLN